MGSQRKTEERIGRHVENLGAADGDAGYQADCCHIRYNGSRATEALAQVASALHVPHRVERGGSVG
jgi:hypothetical protein